MKQFSIALIGIVLVAAVAADQAAWASFKIQHKKTYKNAAEERARMKIFVDRLKEIAEHNELFKNGVVSYEKGLNEFSDMSHDEFSSTMNGYGASNDDNGNAQTHETSDAKIPESIDWRKKGAVTAVRMQKNCPVCWAFASCGALEAAHFLKTGDLIPLSEQNLLDCVKPNETQCYWGSYADAYNYIQRNGIETYDSYPFKTEKDKCNYDPKKNSKVTVNSFVQIPSKDEEALTHAIATVGPIVVAMNSRLIQDYTGGVFHNPNCSQQLNHNMLAVGYGTNPNDGDYYILKNSYGTGWGEDGGYMRLARNKGNLCGIASDAAYPYVRSREEDKKIDDDYKRNLNFWQDKLGIKF